MGLSGFSLFGDTSSINSRELRSATVIVSNDGTGDTDDISEAIAMLPSNGGSIYIKEGTYTLLKYIQIAKPNVYIYGSGQNTVLYTTLNDIVFYVAANNFNLSDVYMLANFTGASQTAIFLGYYCVNAKITRVKIDNFKSTAMSIIQSNKVLISDSEFTNNTTAIMIVGYDNGIIASAVRDCIVSNNIIHNNINNGITIDGVAGYKGEYNIISNNRIYNNGYSDIQINANGNANLIIGNMIVSSTTNLIINSGTNNIIEHNVT